MTKASLCSISRKLWIRKELKVDDEGTITVFNFDLTFDFFVEAFVFRAKCHLKNHIKSNVIFIPMKYHQEVPQCEKRV